MAVIEAAAGLADGASGSGGIQAVLQRRDAILDLCERSHGAILTPRDPGALPRPLRAALAARMAGANGDAVLAAHYHGLIDGKDMALMAIADGGQPLPGVGILSATIVAHVDLMTVDVTAASRDHIEALRRAGLSEPDIVRLQELIAFVNFQLRVVAGLRAIGAAS